MSARSEERVLFCPETPDVVVTADRIDDTIIMNKQTYRAQEYEKNDAGYVGQEGKL